MSDRPKSLLLLWVGLFASLLLIFAAVVEALGGGLR